MVLQEDRMDLTGDDDRRPRGRIPIGAGAFVSAVRMGRSIVPLPASSGTQISDIID